MCSVVAAVTHGFYNGMLDGMEDIEGIRMVEALSQFVHGAQCFSARIAVSGGKSGKQKKNKQKENSISTGNAWLRSGNACQIDAQAYFINCRCFNSVYRLIS